MKYQIKRVIVMSSESEQVEIELGWEPFAVTSCSSRPVGVDEAWTIWLRRVIAKEGYSHDD